MGNSLVNSMVRGFGSTLGRKAANSLTSTNRSHQTQQSNFSKKQLELIQENEEIKKTIVETLETTEMYYTDGKITEGEYNYLKNKGNAQLVEVNGTIEKLKSAGSQSSGSSWPVIIGVLFGIWVLFQIFG